MAAVSLPKVVRSKGRQATGGRERGRPVGIRTAGAALQREEKHARPRGRPPRPARNSALGRDGNARRSGSGTQSNGRGKVLLVDDDEEILSTMGQVIEAIMPEVETVMRLSGKEALRALKSTRGIGVIVSDYKMPDMDGLDLAEAVRKDHPEVAFVLASGFKAQDIRELASGRGVFGFLAKPFTAADFVEVVNAALDSKAEQGLGATAPSARQG